MKYEYDTLDRVTRIANVDYLPFSSDYSESGPATTYEYVGQEAHATDARYSYETISTYDDLYRLHTLENPNGETTTYEYDANGNQTSLTDEKGNVTTWAYDVLNRVQSETIEIDSTPYSREYEYDDNGNVIRKTDSDGRVTEYEYDYLNRMRGGRLAG